MVAIRNLKIYWSADVSESLQKKQRESRLKIHEQVVTMMKTTCKAASMKSIIVLIACILVHLHLVDAYCGVLVPVAGGSIDTTTGTFHQSVGGGLINTQTGSFTPTHAAPVTHIDPIVGVPGGGINARTGEFYPQSGSGFIDTKTGQYIPGINNGHIRQDENDAFPTRVYKSRRAVNYDQLEANIVNRQTLYNSLPVVYDMTNIPTSVYRRGYEYFAGIAVNKNYKLAAKHFMEAAGQDNVNSQYMLGYLHYTGKGVARDYEKAFGWYLEAARQGNDSAQFMLGYLMLTGNGKEKNSEDGLSWLWHAAENGNVYARLLLTYYADVYDDGQDHFDNTAFIMWHAFDNWYLKIKDSDEKTLGAINDLKKYYSTIANKSKYHAALGHYPSQYLLGVMYEAGIGLKRDEEEAIKWYKIAAKTQMEVTSVVQSNSPPLPTK